MARLPPSLGGGGRGEGGGDGTGGGWETGNVRRRGGGGGGSGGGRAGDGRGGVGRGGRGGEGRGGGEGRTSSASPPTSSHLATLMRVPSGRVRWLHAAASAPRLLSRMLPGLLDLLRLFPQPRVSGTPRPPVQCPPYPRGSHARTWTRGARKRKPCHHRCRCRSHPASRHRNQRHYLAPLQPPPPPPPLPPAGRPAPRHAHPGPQPRASPLSLSTARRGGSDAPCRQPPPPPPPPSPSPSSLPLRTTRVCSPRVAGHATKAHAAHTFPPPRPPLYSLSVSRPHSAAPPCWRMPFRRRGGPPV